MKKLSIILLFALVAMISCTKSKEVHPEIGDGNDELLTVGIKNISVKYIRDDIANLQKVVFHYSITDAQQFDASEMTKTSDCFVLTLNGLQSDTLYSYYYELFPYSGNTSNTNQKTFRTQSGDTPAPPTPPSDVPEGAINDLFTINENGGQVYFSKGNLQYQASTNIWRFAENQWNYVGTKTPDYHGYWGGNVEGCDNHDISSNYSEWIDLFGWGTSGWDNNNVCYHPWDTLEFFSGAGFIGHGYGPIDNNSTYDLTDSYANADWGVFNPIYNGGNNTNLWRTLTYSEFVYIINERITSSGIRFAKAQINNVKGLILLPDNWKSTIYDLNNVNTISVPFDNNLIEANQWNVLEDSGAVFLPASGHRTATTVFDSNAIGHYWSASKNGDDHANGLYFSNDLIEIAGYYRYGGFSVRLVQDAE